MPRWQFPRLARFVSRLPRLRTVVLCLAGIIAASASIVLYGLVFEYALPIRRAFHLETEYLYTLGAADLQEQLQASSVNRTTFVPPRRVRPVIEDVPSLHYWRTPTSRTYDEWLTLWFDGSGWPEVGGREYWVYFAGTHKTSALDSTNDTSVFKHRYKVHSCEDPPHTCQSYNEAFNRIAERWHGVNKSPYPPSGTSKALLRYIDCDLSPLLCSTRWGLGARSVMLAHMKIGKWCDWSLGVGRCPVTWRLFGLPMRRAPWTRQVQINLDKGGSSVVPAFPDAEEQMWNLMAHAGAEEGLHFISNPPTASPNMTTNLLVQVNPVRGEVKAWWSFRAGLEYWGLLRTALLDRYYGFPIEATVRCYLERWLDMFLRWWDGPPYVMMPQRCAGIEEELERTRKKMGAAANLINNYHVDARNVFVA